jgi:hypothetical protein
VLTSVNTTSAVDIDELFSLFDKRARKGLRDVIRGFGASYDGAGKAYNAGWLYLNPSLRRPSRLFAELNRDTPLLERFVVASLEARHRPRRAPRRHLGLVDNLATATGALADQKQSRWASAIGQLPAFMRRGQHDVRQPARAR